MSTEVALVGDVWRQKKTGREVQIIRVVGQPPEEWADIRATSAPHWATRISVSGLADRYSLVSDGGPSQAEDTEPR